MTPYFQNFASFIDMGGHGFYVWLCYGITLAVLLFGVVYVYLERKKTLKRLKLNQVRNKRSQAQKTHK